MRYLISLLLVVALSLSVSAARKRADRTGTVKDQIYTDADFRFSISLYEKWKGTPGKTGDTCRIKMIDMYMGEAFERNGGTDSYYLAAPSKVEIWAMISPDSLRDAMIAVFSDSSTNPLHKLYMKAIECNESGAVLQGVTDTRWEKIGTPDNRWLLWSGLYRYTRREGEGKLYLDVGVHLIGRRINDQLVLIVVSYDPFFGDQVYEESFSMLRTFRMVEEK
jgi:hypothetical protein